MSRIILPPRLWTRQPYGAIVYAPQWAELCLPGLIGSSRAATKTNAAITYVGTVGLDGGQGGQSFYTVTNANLARAPIAGSTLGTQETGGAFLIVFSSTETGNDLRFGGLGSDDGGPGNTLFNCCTGSGSAADLRVQVGGSNDGQIYEYAANINDGRVHAVVVSVSRFSELGPAGEITTYLDGSLIGNEVGTNTLGTGSTYNWVCSGGIRRGGTDLAVGATCKVLLVQPLARHVTRIEGLALTRNPWQVFAPMRRPAFENVAAAPASGTPKRLLMMGVGV